MTLHHSFAIDGFKEQCVYCSTSFEDQSWATIHHGVKMYKSTTCPKCSHHVMLPVDFLGSGHDGWDGKQEWKSSPTITFSKSSKKIKTLESKIKILSEKTHP